MTSISLAKAKEIIDNILQEGIKKKYATFIGCCFRYRWEYQSI